VSLAERTVVPSSCSIPRRKNTFLLGMLDPEDTIILQNMGNNSLDNKASQYRQLASSLLHQYHTK